MFGNLPPDVKTDLMKKNVLLKNLSASFLLVIEEFVSIFSFGH
jgi:hypothetical protein